MTDEEYVVKLMGKIGKPVWVRHDFKGHWDVLDGILIDQDGISYRFLSGMQINMRFCSIFENEPDLKLPGEKK